MKHSVMRVLRTNMGNALIELALVLPIFPLLLVGIAEFGRLAYAAIEVTNAARAGVGYGAQNHTTASDVTGMTASATTDGPNLATITVWAGPCICPDTSATASVPKCDTSGTFTMNSGSASNPVSHSFSCPSTITSATEFVQVNTTANVSTLFKYPGFPTSYTLNGSATMVVGQ
jgi:Flp pilus assembly protein TadG